MADCSDLMPCSTACPGIQQGVVSSCVLVQAIEEQSSVLALERAALGRLRTDLEKAMNRLEQERMAWEKTKVGKSHSQITG